MHFKRMINLADHRLLPYRPPRGNFLKNRQLEYRGDLPKVKSFAANPFFRPDKGRSYNFWTLGHLE